MTPLPADHDLAERLTPEEKEACLQALRDKYPPDAIAVIGDALDSGKLTREELQSASFKMAYGGTEPNSTNYAYADEGLMNRKQRRRQQAGEKGRTKTASLDKMYGKLVEDGTVRIVRERGKPPRIVWL